MSTVKKVSVPFYAKVDTDYDLFNSATGFKAEYVNDATGTVTAVVGSFNEIVRTPAGHTATVDVVGALIGATQIPIQAAGTVVAGDVISDGTNMYYVDSVAANVIYIRQPLVASLAGTDELDEVGNTGIYRVQVTIATAGDYTLICRNPEVGMQNVAFPVTIVTEDLDDAHDKLDDIASAIGGVGGRSFYRAFV